MKCFVLTKRKAILALSVAVCVAAGIVFGIHGAAANAAATKTRLVPIYNVKTDQKKISISFDAAWGNEQTQNLIDILGKYSVKTTFFVVGSWVEKYPESVKALADAGHEVCNHSDSHPHMPQLPREKIASEIQNCNQKIKAITGKEPTLFRAPYGDYNNTLIETVKGLNMHEIQWNVDSLDWKDPTPQQIYERVVGKVQPGSIVLLHNGAKNTPAALPSILETLQKQGYEIVPISQLIYNGTYKIDNNGTQIPTDQGTSSGG